MHRKIVLALAIISLIFSIVTIKETYAKYKSSAAGTSSFSIARWKIVINNESILTNTSITNTITPILSGNEHVKDGVIAPRSEGYFDLIIDTTNVDVSYTYTINTNVSENSSVKDLLVTGYSINGNPKITISENNSTITNTVLQTSNLKIINLRIYITWDDSEKQTMDNAEDTLAALSQKNAGLNVLLSFTQVAS